MELKKVQARYSQKCKKCNKQISTDDTIYFNPFTKEVFCKSCGEILLHDNNGENKQIDPTVSLIDIEDSSIIRNINTQVRFITGNSSASLVKLDKIILLLEQLISQNIKPEIKKKK